AEGQMSTFVLSDIATSLLIITQSKKGQCADALASFRAMLAQERLPSQLAVTRLVQALGSSGDVEGIRSVESLMKSLGTASTCPAWCSSTTRPWRTSRTARRQLGGTAGSEEERDALTPDRPWPRGPVALNPDLRECAVSRSDTCVPAVSESS
ncbi:unnamed protein product, partial [Tetraodon nigroviridis]